MSKQISITVDEETARLYAAADERGRERVVVDVQVSLRKPSLSAEEAAAQWQALGDCVSSQLSDEQVRALERELEVFS